MGPIWYHDQFCFTFGVFHLMVLMARKAGWPLKPLTLFGLGVHRPSLGGPNSLSSSPLTVAISSIIFATAIFWASVALLVTANTMGSPGWLPKNAASWTPDGPLKGASERQTLTSLA